MVATSQASPGALLPGDARARWDARVVPIAWLGTGIGVMLTVTGLVVHQWVPEAQRVDLWSTPQPVVGLLAGIVGALIATRRRGIRVAWLLVLGGLFAGTYCAAIALTETGRLAPVMPPWVPWTGWITGWAWLPVLLICLVVLPQVFPDGAPLPGWRWWWRATLVVCVLLAVSLALAPEAPQFPGLGNPLIVIVDQRWSTTIVGVEAMALAALAVGSVACIIARLRRSDALLRRQIGLVSMASILLIASDFTDSAWLRGVACGAYLAAILVAVTRYRLYDIDALVSRGAVGLGLVAILGAFYSVTVAGVGGLIGQVSGPSVAAFAGALVVATAFAPVRDRVRRIVDRAFSLGRADPYDLLASVTNLVRDAPSPRHGVDEVADFLHHRMPDRTILIDIGPAGASVCRAGAEPRGSAATVPLLWQGGEVGRATLGRRAGGLDAIDRRTLAVLSPILGALAHDLLVTRDLDLSRQTVVAAREEERRRLRRDLHDGLGPLLAGAVMSIDAARSARGPGDATALFDDARDAVRRAIGDIRQLVYGLRPPALDDLGLAGAIRSTTSAGQLELSVVCDNLGALPAAVEVAAFRIAQEALTNVARHADARVAEVRLHRSASDLLVDITDDGCGLPARRPGGIGLNSMRERAAEVGGRLSIGPGENGGTWVRAVLPCVEEGR